MRNQWVSRCMFLAALGLMWMAGSRFVAEALDGRSLLAGILVATIATVVGRIIGTQPRARGMTMLASGILFLGIINGWVDHKGEERILWAFACTCGGLLLGTAYPVESDESADGEEASGTSGTRVGEGVERRS